MRISHFGGVETASSLEELELILSKRFGNESNEFWLSEDAKDFPCMAILVKGTLASATFFDDENDIGSQSVGEYNDMQAGTFKVFYANTPKEEIEIHSETVIPLEVAVKAAEEFFTEQEKPGGIKWQKM
jgi:hypothetical protein